MKHKKILIGLLAAVILTVAVVLALLVFNKPKEEDAGTGVSGTISEGWDSGINKGGVESTGIQVPGYKDAKMNAGDTSLHLSIGNPEDNTAGFFATVQLEDGTVLYESPLLEPGFGIKDIPLAQTLEVGTYNAYVVYQIVSLEEDHAPMNTVRSAFTLYVE